MADLVEKMDACYVHLGRRSPCAPSFLPMICVLVCQVFQPGFLTLLLLIVEEALSVLDKKLHRAWIAHHIAIKRFIGCLALQELLDWNF